MILNNLNNLLINPNKFINDYILINPGKIIKDINKLKPIIKFLIKQNLLLKKSMEPYQVDILNNTLSNINVNLDIIFNEQIIIVNLFSGNTKFIKKIIDNFYYLVIKYILSLYITNNISRDILKTFYLNLFEKDINADIIPEIPIPPSAPVPEPTPPSTPVPEPTPIPDSRDIDSRDIDSRDIDRYDIDSRDIDRYESIEDHKNKLFYEDLLGYDYINNRLSLQKIILDMRIRKDKNKLIMPLYKNHEINNNKMDKWIDLQCNDDAKTLARLFKNYTKYVSWNEFYLNSIKVFDELYKFVEGKTYCVFTHKTLGNVSFNDKSNYWMLNLMLDHFINTNKTNLPKELLLIYNKHISPNTNYDYYISIDDCVYSGGQMFTDSIIVNNIDVNKILIVTPYISQYSYDKYNDIDNKKIKRYNKWFYAEIMEYWWKNKKVTLSSKEYILNDKNDRNYIYNMLTHYFPNPRTNSKPWSDNNFMYYFDHKIADYQSSFPSVYHLGIITPYGTLEKKSSLTYDDNGNNSNACINRTYMPFVSNCLNNKPTLKNIGVNAKIEPWKLCIEPWYKKKYDSNYNKLVLVLDFDDIIAIEILDSELNTKPLDEIFIYTNEFIEILKNAWEHLIPVYIVSSRKKQMLIILLNRFYEKHNITFYRIYDNNILGRPNNFPESIFIGKDNNFKNNYWASRKVKYLNFIVNLEKIDKTKLLFCNDSADNINRAIDNGYINSIKINKNNNSKDVLTVFNNFIKSNSNSKYKIKYINHIT